MMRTGAGSSFLRRVPIAKAPGVVESRAAFVMAKGVTPKTEQVKIKIPAGVDTGSARSACQKGHGGRLGAEPGRSLHSSRNVGQHPFLTRKGENVVHDVKQRRLSM